VRSQLKANLGFCPVEVERHVLCTRPWKSLTLDSLDSVSDKEIQTALADQSVSKACTLIGKRGWQPFLLHTVCLISEVPPLPASVHIGYERILSALIFLTPCVAIAARNWASNLICGHCGGNGHSEEPCPSPPHCVGCTGAHASGDRKYLIYLDEKAIREHRVTEGFTFPDARKKFLETKAKTGASSYASVLHRPQGVDAAAQQLHRTEGPFQLSP
jgi:hypothetical protein